MYVFVVFFPRTFQISIAYMYIYTAVYNYQSYSLKTSFVNDLKFTHRSRVHSWYTV